jgi:hypothetical protein
MRTTHREPRVRAARASVAALIVATCAAASAAAGGMTHSFVALKTNHFSPGATLRVRASRLSDKRIAVSTTFTVHVVHASSYSLGVTLIGPHKLVDPHGHNFVPVRLSPGTHRIARTTTVVWHHAGALRCVALEPVDRTSSPQLSGQVVRFRAGPGVTALGAQVCP